MKLSSLLVASSVTLAALVMPSVSAYRALREASAASSSSEDPVVAGSLDPDDTGGLVPEDSFDSVDGRDSFDSFDASLVRPIAPHFRFQPPSDDKPHADVDSPARDLAQHSSGKKFRGPEPETETDPSTPTVVISTTTTLHGDWKAEPRNEPTPLVFDSRRHFKG